MRDSTADHGDAADDPLERLDRLEETLGRQVEITDRLDRQAARHEDASARLVQDAQAGHRPELDVQERHRVEEAETVARRRAQPHAVTTMFTDYLTSIEAVDQHVRKSCVHAIAAGEPLPPDVAEPGPLMAHVVGLAGPVGITQERLLAVFRSLDTRRKDDGLAAMRHDGRVVEAAEQRPDTSGRTREQIVYRSLIGHAAGSND